MVSFEESELLRPVSAHQPCGPELYGTPQMAHFEEAMKPPTPRMFEEKVIDTRNWVQLREQAIALLKQSKDLRLTHHLTIALMHTDGVEGMVAAARVVVGLLEGFWDQLYPELDPDDDDDPTMRLNCLRELGGTTVVQFLRDYPLVNNPIGQFSSRDVQLATGEVKSDEPSPPLAEVRAAFQMGHAEARDLAVRLQQLQQELTRMSSVFLGRSGVPLQLPSLTRAVANMLKAVNTMCPEELLVADDAGSNGSLPAEMDGEMTQNNVATGVPGRIQNRQDVVVALKLICEYYARQEPSSPIPLLLKRAERLVEKSFPELLRDLADKGLPQLELIAGDIKGDD